jgi:hypothetical protein
MTKQRIPEVDLRVHAQCSQRVNHVSCTMFGPHHDDTQYIGLLKYCDEIEHLLNRIKPPGGKYSSMHREHVLVATQRRSETIRRFLFNLINDN